MACRTGEVDITAFAARLAILHNPSYLCPCKMIEGLRTLRDLGSLSEEMSGG